MVVTLSSVHHSLATIHKIIFKASIPQAHQERNSDICHEVEINTPYIFWSYLWTGGEKAGVEGSPL